MKKILIVALLGLLALTPAFAAMNVTPVTTAVVFTNIDLSTATTTYTLVLENVAQATKAIVISLTNTTEMAPGFTAPNVLGIDPSNTVTFAAATASTNAYTNITLTVTSASLTGWPTNQLITYNIVVTNSTDGGSFTIPVTIGFRSQYSGYQLLNLGTARIRPANEPTATAGQMGVGGQSVSNLGVKTISGVFTVNSNGVTAYGATRLPIANLPTNGVTKAAVTNACLTNVTYAVTNGIIIFWNPTP